MKIGCVFFQFLVFEQSLGVYLCYSSLITVLHDAYAGFQLVLLLDI
jgi:hypothetical protein